MEQFAAQALPYVAQFTFALLAIAGTAALRWMSLKAKNDYQRGVILRAGDAIEQAVSAEWQTTVADLKAKSAGGLTKAEAAEAFRSASERVRVSLGKNGVAEVERVIGVSLDEYLATAIEASLAKIRTQIEGKLA